MSGHLLVLECGAATTLQDGGRRGFARYGLSASGPMDPLAHAAANLLVGNEPEATALELGLSSGRFRAEGGPVRVAVTGALCRLDHDGEAVGQDGSLTLQEGETLRIERPRAGVYAVLALAGGIRAPAVMGSAALHLRAAIGGLDGRPLREGDQLHPAAEPGLGGAERGLDPVPLDREAPIRVVLGPQADHFTPEGLDTLRHGRFTVSHRADRMGCQLDGPRIAHGPQGFNIVSDGTVAGSIQVPGAGTPIILLADRQTTGGYPKIATVISADLRRVAQRRPGEALRFEVVTVEEAVRLARERAALLAALPGRLRPALSEAERLSAANLAGDAVDAFAG